MENVLTKTTSNGIIQWAEHCWNASACVYFSPSRTRTDNHE